MKEITLKNLTPHDINIVGYGVLPKCETPARVEVELTQIGTVNGIAVFQNQYGKVNNLPDETGEVWYIVSLIVANAIRGSRKDCYVVNETVRDESGRIIGCKSLSLV